MQIDRRQIESSLPRKGFTKEDTHHRYFYHEYDGKRTGIYTYTSHGSSFKTYGDPLLRSMKGQLRLDTVSQLSDLLLCPMSGDDYSEHLKSKGLLTEAPATTSEEKRQPKRRTRRRKRR